MSLLGKIRRYGLFGCVERAANLIAKRSGYAQWRCRGAPVYRSPNAEELEAIEHELAVLGIDVESWRPPAEPFEAFKSAHWFPPDYHGGLKGGVWDEKLLEHWLASERLGLMQYGHKDIYVDMAAASSPWVRALRERKQFEAYAIDLGEVGDAYGSLPYYRIEDATRTSFASASVAGATLHCAYEMFLRDDDTAFIEEAARILRPGGRIVILPLYMHTHYCAYSTPEYFNKGYSDPAAKEYVRMDSFGVPSSRKYDAVALKRRVLDPIVDSGMRYRLLALRNKQEFGRNIYCHFILEIER